MAFFGPKQGEGPSRRHGRAPPVCRRAAARRVRTEGSPARQLPRFDRGGRPPLGARCRTMLRLSASSPGRSPRSIQPSWAVALARRTRGLVAALVCLAPSAGYPEQPASDGREGLVVVAPHPDDEVLMAAGLMAAAVKRGEPVNVIVLTHGDFDCRTSGRRRRAESLAGLSTLGVAPQHVFFLGYPDGYLSRLGETPLPPVRRLIDGRCQLGNTVYESRTARKPELARRAWGEPYTRQHLLRELRSLLVKLKPARLVVSHPSDTHPDHAAAHTLVRRALEGVSSPPLILRSLVHLHDCWPTGPGEGASCRPGAVDPSAPMPNPTGSLAGYEPDVRVPVPLTCTPTDPRKNVKVRAIAAHLSQTRGDLKSYLFSFARRDEMFFSERLVRDERGTWAPEPRAPLEASVGLLPSSGRGRRVEQRLPLSWSMELERPAHATPRRVPVLEGPWGRYVLAFDGDGLHVDLSKELPCAPPRLMQRWQLAHDTWSRPGSSERFELRGVHHPSWGDIAEFTLLQGGRLVGVAVDPDPLASGHTVTTVDNAQCGGANACSVETALRPLPCAP